MSNKSLYIPSLDGMRAFAVIAVILYHLDSSYLPSGLLGVTVFFVLSGYLITGLLIKEWRTSGKIDLPQFWLRRVRRLVPAIVLVLLTTTVLTALFAPDLLTKLRSDIPAALLFFTNWWYIFQDVSYFEALGAPSPVTHFWSLAIEEQFYLIWPPVLYLLFGRRVKFKHIRRGLLIAAAASMLAMALLYDPAGDPSRVYYGTDTRVFSLLIGSWLAFVFPAERFRIKGRPDAEANLRTIVGRTLCGRGPIPPEAKRITSIVGAAAFVAMVAMMACIDGYSPALYYGGIALLSVLTALAMLALLNPESLLCRVFSWKPLVWIGKRSYGIYLWHYPLFLLMTPQNFTGITPWWMQVLKVGIVIAVAALSYTYVENPLRHKALGKAFDRIRTRETSFALEVKNHAIQVGATTLLTVAAVIGLIAVAPTSAVDNAALYQSPNAENADASTSDANDEGSGSEDAENPAATAEAGYDVLLIGDSVTVATQESFSDTFPSGIIDAQINRQLSAAVDLYQQHVDAGWDGQTVIMALGTNGPITTSQLEETIAAVPTDKELYLVTNRMPEDWQDGNNQKLFDVAAQHENVKVIDWYSISANHDEYFAGDGTHLTPTGAQAYLSMLDAVVSS